MAECKRRKATLVIAKLDRLARNVAFISALMENGTDFIACDMPHANKLTIQILAAVAEHEREMISVRTKAALAAAKARGTKLGNPRWAESIESAWQANNPIAVSPQVVQMVRQHRRAGETLRYRWQPECGWTENAEGQQMVLQLG
jgi:DNA invertase Pin-like site-specific DNA recombinase